MSEITSGEPLLSYVPVRQLSFFYCRIFCHAQNLFWSLEQIDPSQIEAPKVPSGMTGGVEYEAMAYCVRLRNAFFYGLELTYASSQASHFRLLNALVKTCPTREEAFRLHNDLFDSGLERVLLVSAFAVHLLIPRSSLTDPQTLRRASLVYYQSLHLEMSRYISLARSAGFNLGPRILACLDVRTLGREEQMVLSMFKNREAETARQRSRTVGGAPQLGDVNFS